MGMTGFYGPSDDAESVATIRAALDAGVTLFDTADRYGLGRNEELVGRALAGSSGCIATKFGIVPGPTPGERMLDGSSAYVRKACEASLKRLGRPTIDLYFLHRVDRNVPIEETVGAMSRLVEEGKVRYLGLCEVGPDTLRRACAVWPISAVQSEYSLWCREQETTIFPACRALGVGFIAYSALAIGMLTGTISRLGDLTDGDLRHSSPRFQDEHLSRNLERVRALQALANRLGCTPAQLSLAWILAHDPMVVPLVGTKRTSHLAENVGALNVEVDSATAEELERIFPIGSGSGDRYPPDGMRWLNG